jgi:hypothetical protein
MEPRLPSPPRTAIKKYKTGVAAVLVEKDWLSLEQILGAPLPTDVRDKINSANSYFAAFGALHGRGSTVTVKAANKSIDAWYKASGRLLLKIGSASSATKIDRATFLREFSKKKSKRLRRMQPLSFLGHALSACMAVSLSVGEELSNSSSASILGPDMWRAWVCLIARAMKDAGIRPSASSSNKGTESPFIRAIEYLHQSLPNHCRRYNGYESIAKEVQKAREQFKKADEKYLMFLLLGFGSNILGGYGHPESAELVEDLGSMPSDEWRDFLEGATRALREKRKEKGM